MNWGPLTWLNAVYKTFGWWSLRRGSYDQDFHTYVLEWDQDFMYVFLSCKFRHLFANFILHKRRIYVDTRLHHMLDLTMNIPFFQRGDFPGVVQNGSEAIILADPWSNGTKAAPFDQCEFSFSPWLPSPSLFCPLYVGLLGTYELFSFFNNCSVLSDPGCGCWWYEWMVSRWF